MASTGVFVHVICALKRSNSGFSRTPSTILTYLETFKKHSHQNMRPESDFYEGR